MAIAIWVNVLAVPDEIPGPCDACGQKYCYRTGKQRSRM